MKAGAPAGALPAAAAPAPLVEVRDLAKWFPVRRRLGAFLRGAPRRHVRAVDGVDLAIAPGESLGLGGESGSGKTVTGELLSLLHEPTRGRIRFDGEDLAGLRGRALKAFRRKAQMIFQDPYGSLNPRFTARRAVLEPLAIHRLGEGPAREARAREALELAELRPAGKYLGKYPHELSGGERQRLAIARAVVLRPRFLVADEPTSMLDVSISAGILNLLQALRAELGLGMLFISHDFSVLRYLCDRTAIMYLGRIVEVGPTAELIREPCHPYTRFLIAAVPSLERGARRARVAVPGEVPDAIEVPSGCRFHPRCPFRERRCVEEVPAPKEVAPGRFVACHLF